MHFDSAKCTIGDLPVLAKKAEARFWSGLQGRMAGWLARGRKDAIIRRCCESLSIHRQTLEKLPFFC